MRIPEFTIRYLGRDEARAWAAVGAPSGADLAGITNQLIPLLHDAARDTAEFIVAEAIDGRFLGTLRASFPVGAPAEMLTPNIPDPVLVEEVGRGLIARFLAECWGRQVKQIRGTLLLEPSLGDPAPLRSLFAAMGFQPQGERWVLSADLMSWKPSVDLTQLQYRSLHDIGNRAFVDLLEEVRRIDTGSPRDPASADADFRAMRQAAGNILEATLWQIGYHEGIPVGLVIPQAWPDDPTTGDLFVWGVVPDQRGHGWGRVLFERGLQLLKTNWVKNISGSIDATNTRAWTLYQSMGATVVEKQELWEGPSMS